MSTIKVDRKIFEKIYHGDVKHLIYAGNHDFIEISIDSRKASKDCVFFALIGDINDGHDFIGEVIDKGAALIVANNSHKSRLAKFDQHKFFWVENTLEIFSKLAHYHLQQFDIKKIAITGSNGKTTTKEMLKAALESIIGKDKVYANSGSYNNHFGVPLSALEVNDNHEVAIFEMGMNHSGELSALCRIIEPTFGVITNIGPAHAGNFANGIEGVQKAKAELFEALNNIGHAAINIDDERILSEANIRNFKSITTFGQSPKAQIRLLEIKPYSLEQKSQQIIIGFSNDRIYKLNLAIPGLHHAKNALAVLALVNELGFSLEQACLGLAKMKAVDGRMAVCISSNNVIIIDDAYNANPESMAEGIKTSLDFKATRRIAVVGNMGELGMYSTKSHLELGDKLHKSFDYLFVCGKQALEIIDGAKNSGMNSDNIFFINNVDEAIIALEQFIKSGDLVFIKGSHSNNMSKLACALRAKD